MFKKTLSRATTITLADLNESRAFWYALGISAGVSWTLASITIYNRVAGPQTYNLTPEMVEAISESMGGLQINKGDGLTRGIRLVNPF